MTDYARKLAINKLAELQAQGFSATAVLEQSIFNSWQGLFAPHANGNTQIGTGPTLHLSDEERQRLIENHERRMRKQ